MTCAFFKSNVFFVQWLLEVFCRSVRLYNPKKYFRHCIEHVLLAFPLKVALFYSSSSNLPSFLLVIHLPLSHPPPSSFSDSKQPSRCVSPITASTLIPVFLPSIPSFLSPFLSNHQLLSLKAKGPLQTLAKKIQEVQNNQRPTRGKGWWGQDDQGDDNSSDDDHEDDSKGAGDHDDGNGDNGKEKSQRIFIMTNTAII